MRKNGIMETVLLILMGNQFVFKKRSRSKKLSVYSNLAASRGHRKAAVKRQRERLASKAPDKFWNKMLFYAHPANFAKFWFSKQGLITGLKLMGVAILLFLILIGGLFAYFRKDLDAISPGEIAKRVQTTVNSYYDRNGDLIWEDKGDGNYKLVVDSGDLSEYLKKATVAIEDQNFYSHKGVSLTGTLRAVVNNATGGEVQGGSTLTQQLVKQVFFADESQNRGLGGIPRKIKELILAIEVERMYDKDQILSLYLNESPYGGRRNGAESAAQTYFGKSAKNLTIAEAALLAAIPQNPALYNPYNTYGNEALIVRQHIVINNMVDQGMITKEEGETAKNQPILDTLKPVGSQYAGVKAPHFVQMVRAQLEEELGAAVVGRGGLKITTTLDLRIQDKLIEAMNDMFASNTPASAGFSNGAATVEDVKTGQIIAMQGSRDFAYEGFGQDNAALASIQPGSTIKPLVYSELFSKKADGAMNYGSGSILKDENIDSIYGATVNNADRQFKGDITIRSSLATSRNIPAIKAMYISGVKNTLATIRSMGATSYCTVGVDAQAGLSSAIGGCGVKQVDLVNAYSSIARGGVYMKQSSVLEVKNSNGDVLTKWAEESKRIVDSQATYIVSDILTDDNARAPLAGRNAKGMVIPGVQTATKTGTSDKDGQAKDIWMMSYSPVIAMGVWLGNSDTTILKKGTSSIPAPIIAKVMEFAHKEVYAKDGRWKTGDWFTQPAGIQRIGGEVYPSWWSKDAGQSEVKVIFDKLSKKKATDCTPELAKIEVAVKKYIDPITKKDAYIVTDTGYDANKEDDVHLCNDVQPSISIDVSPKGKSANYTITASVTKGTYNISNVEILVDGRVVATLPAGSSYSYSYSVPSGATGTSSVTATVIDENLYSSTASAVSISN